MSLKSLGCPKTKKDFIETFPIATLFLKTTFVKLIPIFSKKLSLQSMASSNTG